MKRTPKHKSMHTQTRTESDTRNPEIMWKYSFSFNLKSHQSGYLKKEGSISLLHVAVVSRILWVHNSERESVCWPCVLLQFPKNSPFVFVNVLTAAKNEQTCFRNWFDSDRKCRQKPNRTRTWPKMRAFQKHGHMRKGRCYICLDQILIFCYCCWALCIVHCAMYWQLRRSVFRKWWAKANETFSNFSQ